jgi:hypothetical protein
MLTQPKAASKREEVRVARSGINGRRSFEEVSPESTRQLLTEHG